MNTRAPAKNPSEVPWRVPAVSSASSISSKETALSSTPEPKPMMSPSDLVCGGRKMAITAPRSSEPAAKKPHAPAANMAVIMLRAGRGATTAAPARWLP